MRVVDTLYHWLLRCRYPVSLPEDIAKALGVRMSNQLNFNEFISILSSPSCRPTKLTKFMPRELAEAAFQSAVIKERFHQNTLCSYYFNDGWLEFVLQFDDRSRLRRIYLQHKNISCDEGIEILLSCSPISKPEHSYG